MKKLYISPKTRIIEVQSQSILQESAGEPFRIQRYSEEQGEW